MTLRVALAADAPDDAESAAIAAWLATRPDTEAVRVPLRDIADTDADASWIHGVQPVRLESLGGRGPAFVLRGRILLTGGAATIAADAGLEDLAPDVRPGDAAGPDSARGHATYRGHPLFTGLGDATDLWRPGQGVSSTRVSYVQPAWPRRARVIAVERGHGSLNTGRATIWEHDGERGPVLCIGSHLPLNTVDPGLRANAEALAANALGRVAGRLEGEGPAGPWRHARPGTREDRSIPVPELPLMEEPLGAPEFRLRATGDAAADRPFTVAGRRLFVTGGEARGIDEVWAHPFRVATGIRLRDAVVERVTVTPVGIERRLRVNGALVLERLVVPREAPVALLEWQSRSGTVELELDWTSGLRLMWPYPPGAAGPLRWRRAARGIVIAAGEDDRAVFAFSHQPETLEVEDASADASRVHVRARLRLLGGNSARLALAGGSGDALVSRAVRAADRTVAAVRSRQAHADQLMTDRLALDTADTAAAQAIEWAKIRLASYVVEAPGLGRSLVAGYGPSRALPPDDGRPCCAWYVARDTVWTALACLAVGEAGTARDALVFLGRHQAASGRVPQECTTSGFIHYGGAGARATALYLLLAARYLAWTGDLSTIQTEWPRVLLAYEYCLGEAWQTFSGAGVWAAALRELVRAGEAIGDRGSVVEIGQAADRAAAALDALPGTEQGLAPHEAEDDSGAGPAVPLLLGVVDPGAMAGWLDAVAARSPVTGWVAWAEYAAGRAEAGFAHWRAHLERAFRHQRGAWTAPPDRDDGGMAASPDRACSAALAVLPLVHGLLGAEPDATRGRLVLRPAPPAAWSSFAVRRLPLGEAAVSLAYRRSGDTHAFRLRQEQGGPPVRVVLEPALPGRRLRAARVDGGPAELESGTRGQRVVVPIQVVLDHERRIEIEVDSGPPG